MKSFLILSAMLFWFISGFSFYPIFFPPIIDTTPIIHVVKEVKQETLVGMIAREAMESGISVDTALRIADCESKMGKYKINWSGSSAYGLYQFMPRTFNAYCQGVIESDIDQIRCFIKLYPKHPNWWACKI